VKAALAWSAALALILVIGCGSEDDADPQPPVPDGPPKHQIAETVNAMFDAWNDGDGELACEYMTARGQRLAARIARQLHQLEGAIDPDGCAEAIEGSAAAIDETIGQTVAPDAVMVQGRRGSVASEFRGALAVRQVDGVWLVDVPTFID
jgi:hypothetical protein